MIGGDKRGDDEPRHAEHHNYDYVICGELEWETDWQNISSIFLDMVAMVMMTVELVLIVMVALKGKYHLRSANHQIIL